MQHMNATFVHDRLRASGRWQCPRGAVAVLAAATVLTGLLAASPTGQGPQFPDTVPEWIQQGRVSWYGPGFHGRRTANGEVFDTHGLTMAHRSLPMGTNVRVTNLENGRSVVLRVNDRGPYVRGRVADLSHAAAERLGFVDDGVVPARIELL
jgi:rare lipoprotein A